MQKTLNHEMTTLSILITDIEFVVFFHCVLVLFDYKGLNFTHSNVSVLLLVTFIDFHTN